MKKQKHVKFQNQFKSIALHQFEKLTSPIIINHSICPNSHVIKSKIIKTKNMKNLKFKEIELRNENYPVFKFQIKTFYDPINQEPAKINRLKPNRITFQEVILKIN